MLSLILRRDFFEFGQKKIFPEALESICWCQKWFFKIVAVLETLKIIKNIEFLTRMLRPLCARWAYGSGTYAHAKRARQELMRALCIRVRNWCVHWAYASGTNTWWSAVPLKHAAYASVPGACTERTGQELMRMLSVRIINYMMPSSPKN